MFLKICGMTSTDAVDAALAAGVDALGFVFAESPREVTAEQALSLSEAVPGDVVRVAVMHHPSAALVAHVLGVFEPDWLQTDAEDFEAISLPADCAAVPVFRNGHVPMHDDQPPRLLFEGAISGSGKVADWNEARELAQRTELILAGGLDAHNVVDAIEQVKPWGVDVSSGVEREPGRKDAGKIREFVARVRTVEK